MSIRTSAAIATAKLAHTGMRLLGRNGRALPGLIALKIQPKLIEELGPRYKTIVITGTNGKTTTTHIVQQAVIDACGRAAYDPSSTNLDQGIATTLSLDSSIGGQPGSQWAVIESDEGASKILLPAMRPAVMVVTNLYRDQVDRYPTWTTARDYIIQAAKSSPETVLVLDADCQVTASIADAVENPVVWFGVDCDVWEDGIGDADEHVACIACGAELDFARRSFAHLGDWSCPACGRRRPALDISCTAVTERREKSCTLNLCLGAETRTAQANIRAGYDIYNAVAAVAGLRAAGFANQTIFGALASFKHAAHRFEIFNMDGNETRLLLMKNTAGANQLINMILSEDKIPENLVCLLGAEIMDGLSTEWIEGVRWESIISPASRIIVGGPEYEAMRARLLAAGADAERLSAQTDYAALVRDIAALRAPVTVIANCSTIEALRVELVKHYSPIDYWSE